MNMGSPISIAGLPGSRAWVWVGPPLSANGPSSGLITPLIGPPMRLPFASGMPMGEFYECFASAIAD